MKCSRISEVVGQSCLKILDDFSVLKLSTNQDGSVTPQLSTSNFFEFKGEIYVTKAAISETIRGFVTMYENTEQKSRDLTVKLH